MKQISLFYIFLFSIFVLAILSVLVVISVFYIPKYNPVEQPVISLNFDEDSNLSYLYKNNNDITFDYTNGTTYFYDNAGNNGRNSLILDAGNNYNSELNWTINKNGEYKYLLFECEISSKDIVKSDKKYPSIWLYVQDGDGKKYWDNLYVIKIYNHKNITRVFYLPDFTKKINFNIKNNSISGQVFIYNIKLIPVEKNTVFIIYRNSIFIAFFTSLLIFLIIYRKKVIKIWSFFIILFVILAGILGPKYYFYRIAYYLNIDELIIQKTGHFFFFGILSYFIFIKSIKYYRYNKKKHANIFIFLSLIVLAGITEILQYFTYMRTMNIFDWLIDCSGIFLGVLLSIIADKKARVKS